ncbi:Band 7 domain, partial [Trinorchestia longiramus]
VLKIASEQFLGMSQEEMMSTILMTLEGHLRAILATLTVEEVYRDRDQFASLVRDVAGMDVGRMGIEILSFTIKDVYDRVEYLTSLGRSQTAAVKRDADIGVAMANRDAGIREAECEKTAMDVKYTTDTKIEDNARMYKLQKAQFDTEVNAALTCLSCPSVVPVCRARLSCPSVVPVCRARLSCPSVVPVCRARLSCPSVV